MFLLKSWMSPSNCMIYLSAQVKRFWNVVKWPSPSLVFENPAMSILISELEKLRFFSFLNFRELVPSLTSYSPRICVFCPEGCADFCNSHRRADRTSQARQTSAARQFEVILDWQPAHVSLGQTTSLHTTFPPQLATEAEEHPMLTRGGEPCLL